MLPENSKITDFCHYLEKNYIASDSFSSKYMGFVFFFDRNQTTNACESFHADFNLNFYHQHPHIYKIIEIFKVFQTNTCIKIRTANSGRLRKIRKKKNHKKIKFIEKKINEYS